MRHNFNLEIKNQIINDFIAEKISKKEIREKYKIGQKYFYKLLEEFNIKNKTRKIDWDFNKYRTYFCDFRFFEKIDTEEKAYFLGILASDGHITHTHLRHTVTLGMNDLDVLEKFIKCLNSNSSIKKRLRNNPKWKTSYKIDFYSIDMVHDLQKYDMCGKKSHRTKIHPLIPENLIKHFIRGYFDGDGSITQDKRRNSWGSVTICSCSKLVLEQIEAHLKKNKILRENRDFIENGHGGCFSLRTSKRDEMLRVLAYLYEDSKVFMDRKIKLYQKLKEKPLRFKKQGATSQYWGVSKFKNRFRVNFRNGKQILNMGSFKNEIDAAIAYNNKIKELNLLDKQINIIQNVQEKTQNFLLG